MCQNNIRYNIYTPRCPYCQDTSNQINLGISDTGGNVNMKCEVCTHKYISHTWEVVAMSDCTNTSL